VRSGFPRCPVLLRSLGTQCHTTSLDLVTEIALLFPKERRAGVAGLSIPMWDARSRQSATPDDGHETRPERQKADGKSLSGQQKVSGNQLMHVIPEKGLPAL
jgi:hypothetical protein